MEKGPPSQLLDTSSNEIILKTYSLKKCIGTGCFGAAFEAVENESGQLFFVKKVSFFHLQTTTFLCPNFVKVFS